MELFSWGANSHGQLGQGHCNDTWMPVQLDIAGKSRVTSVAGGGGHSSLVTDVGDLLLCGLNDQGQLGDPSEDGKPVPIMRHLPQLKVLKVACGWDFTIAIASTGQLWSWGSNRYGQIAQGISCEKMNRPTIIEFLRDRLFVDVSAGLRHAAALSTSGDVWNWGNARRGQVLRKETESSLHPVFQPARVSTTAAVKSVHCGSFFTLLLSDCGELYGWGDNRKGQLTLDPKVTGPAVAHIVQLSVPRILWLDVGWNHVLAVSDGGRVLSWGRGDYEQLGRPCTSIGFDPLPSPVDLPTNVTKVCCGSEHSFALTEDGCLFAWGWNEHGMCAVSEDVMTVPFPRQVFLKSNKKVVFVGAGAGHSFACVQSC